MATVSPTQVSDGTTADASDINTPINELAGEINGNLDSDNLSDNAVTTAKLAADSVTGEKIASYNIIHENNDTAIANVNDLLIKSGFGSVEGTGAASVVSEAITFDTAFPNEVLAITITGSGRDTVSAPTDIEDVSTSATGVHWTSSAHSATGFTAHGQSDAGSNLSSGTHYSYSWIAIGR